VAAAPLVVAEIDAQRTHDLRRRVLREGMPDQNVDFAHDRDPGAIHLAALEGERVVAVATFWPEPAPAVIDAHGAAVRLRGMAVDPEWQGQGLGRLLMKHAYALLPRRGFDLLWANARDTAIGFYERMGMDVVGEGFVAVGLPHHVVVRRLGRDDLRSTD
jgi:GNAT superfamily N-acetyltransferase